MKSQVKPYILDPMHPCLNVEEIIRLIACELVASGGKKTAVALACCCKIFEDPVLDALWETQDRFGPLLKSFPEDVWAENVNFVSAATMCGSLSLNSFRWIDFQENPDSSRMDPLSKVRSEDPDAQTKCVDPPIARCSLSAAAPYPNHTVASGSEDSPMP